MATENRSFSQLPRAFSHTLPPTAALITGRRRGELFVAYSHTRTPTHTLTIIAPLAETDARVLLSKLVGESRIAPANLRRKLIACCVSRLKNSSAAPSFFFLLTLFANYLLLQKQSHYEK